MTCTSFQRSNQKVAFNANYLNVLIVQFKNIHHVNKMYKNNCKMLGDNYVKIVIIYDNWHECVYK